MNSIVRSALCALGLIFAAAVPTAGAVQPFTYDNPGEVAGAAALAPVAKRRLVAETTAYCAGMANDLADASRQSLVRWEERNGGYVAAAERVYASIKKEVGAGAEAAKNLAELDQYRTSVIEQTSPMMANMIKALPQEQGRRSMCKSTLAAIDAGRFDIANDDPKIVALLKTHMN
ncbi:hypothetical protein J5226_25170 [Lysobacter sp. K5869]|uniref:hypothetical protein n=1 Tax=Lysobacter sp. K5869 TaxID=2820808 RepID=UPI001C06490B|nr:hypothetical protein [Lysobacter sp. K5869]QWP76815.1 hypothetical protein J5226_25170 [Lysobacter sp. K5869]